MPNDSASWQLSEPKPVSGTKSARNPKILAYLAWFKPQKSNPAAMQMSVLEHLQELRKRILWAAFGLVIAMVVAWNLYPYLLELITSALNTGQSLNFTTVGQAFDLQLQVSWWVGLGISSPWWLLQIWLYIAPGLYRKEKIYLFSFSTAALILFLLGAMGGAYLAPQAVEVLTSFTPSGATSYLTATNYISFFVTLMAACGFSGVFPVILVALNFLNLISLTTLLHIWRWVVLGAFLFAAVINPLPSPLPMILQALILVGVYGLALLVCIARKIIRNASSKPARPSI